MKIEALCRELVKGAATRNKYSRIVSELVSSKFTIASRHLNKIRLINRRFQDVPHDSTEDQQQQCSVCDTCIKLLENPKDSRRFWRGRIVTDGDEKWIKPAAQPTLHFAAKQNRFTDGISKG